MNPINRLSDRFPIRQPVGQKVERDSRDLNPLVLWIDFGELLQT